jgi:hypothetical protein
MSNAVVPFEQMQLMAQTLSKSKLFGTKSADELMGLMLVAQAEGKHPAIVARDYDIIQGRPSKKSEAMLRDFLEAGGSVIWNKLDDTEADATFSHPAGGSATITWDLKRAAQAGLAGKDMWKKWPRQMLRSRTISEGVRTIYPVATSGMYVPEEIHDMGPEKDVGSGSAVPLKRNVRTAEPGAFAAASEALAPEVLPPAPEPDLISEAQKKRLEARIGELKLDREAIKALCKERLGKEHFAELTKGEYADLDALIDKKAEKAKAPI